jgi:uncharacterized membrane protein YjjP (DUF1212 family)
LMALISRHVAASGFRVGLGIWIRSVCNMVINLRLFFCFFQFFTFTFFAYFCKNISIFGSERCSIMSIVT